MALVEVHGFRAKFLVKRKTGMSFQDFVHHQKTVHVPLALQLPGILDYRLSFFEPVDGVDQAFDAEAEVTFESAEAQAAAMASAQGAEALADLPLFLHEPENNTVLVSQPGQVLTLAR